MSESILIVGRGPSAHDFDWASVDCPIMAVSSGIFAIPEGVRCDHFVTLDEPKCYMAPLMNGVANAWGDDPHSRHWQFWTEPTLVKHVVEKRRRSVTFVPIPFREIMEAIKESCDRTPDECARTGIGFNEIRDAFYAAFGESGIGQFGFQPGWGDYPNVRGWLNKAYRHPKWFGDGPIACWKSRQHPDGFLFNSLLAAVQVAARLGYTTHNFIGVDLLPETGYGDSLVVAMKAWHKHAVRNGIEWINLSPISRLGEFMPGPEETNDAQQFDVGEFAKQQFGDRPVKIVPCIQDGMMGFDIIPQDAPTEVAAA